MFDFLFEPWLKWFINSQHIWQILLFWTDPSIKLSDCSSSLCPNTVQSEYKRAPLLHHHILDPSHITQGRLSHAAVWLQSSTHATAGDEQEQPKGTAQCCTKLVLPTACHQQHALVSTPEAQLWFHQAGPEKKKICRLFIFCCRCRCCLMTVFPPRLWHGEHPSYLSMVCSGNFSKTNTQRMEGSASPYKPPPLLPPPTGSSLLPRKNRLQLSEPHNAQCWQKSQVKHTFSNCLVTCSLSCTDTEAGGLGITQWGTFRRSHGILLLSNPPTLDH